MVSKWIEHVRRIRAEHPGMSYKDAMIQAKGTYSRDSLVGGKIDKKQLGSFLDNSYTDAKEQKKEINGFERDDELSGNRAQVYRNPKSGKVIVAHRGTKDLSDVVTDVGLAVGYRGGRRFKHGERVQKQAEAKYGSENVTTIGHSLGSSIAEKVGKNSRKIITANKPVVPTDILFGKTPPKNQTDIRTSFDPVSILRPLQKGKVRTIKSKTYNPLTEHSVAVLGRGLKTTSPWIMHCKEYASKHNCSYKDAMKLAKSSYKK